MVVYGEMGVEARTTALRAPLQEPGRGLVTGGVLLL